MALAMAEQAVIYHLGLDAIAVNADKRITATIATRRHQTMVRLVPRHGWMKKWKRRFCHHGQYGPRGISSRSRARWKAISHRE